MAIDAIEGEQKLGYMASRREQLWRLLQMETAQPSMTAPEIASTVAPKSSETPSDTKTNAPGTTSKQAKTTPKKRSSPGKSQVPTQFVETNQEPAPKKRQTTKKRQTRKKTQDTTDKAPAQTKFASSSADEGVVDHSPMEPPTVDPTPPQKKRRVGQRKPKRDPVGP